MRAGSSLASSPDVESKILRTGGNSSLPRARREGTHESPTMVVLDENSIKSMMPGRFFRDHKAAVNSLDFHHTEDVMVTVGACPPAISWVFFTARARSPSTTI